MNATIRPPKIDATQLQPYAKAGVTLIPLRPWDSRDANGNPTGKLPLKGWLTNPYNAAKVIANSIKTNRNVGWRIDDGYVGFDFDPRNTFGDDELSMLLAKHDIDPATLPTMDSGGSGVHVYFRVPKGIKFCNTVPGFDAVEVKGVGRFVVAAGSIHPSGKMYRWREGCPPLSDAPDMPAALLEALKRPVVDFAATGGGCHTPEEIVTMLDVLDATKFNTNDTWLPLMCAVHHASGGDARQEWIDWSTSDPAFANDAELIGQRWDSLHTEKPGAITVKSLYKALHDAGKGGLIPTQLDEDEFETETESTGEDWPPDSDEQPIPKLTKVDKASVDRMFKLVNMGGKLVVQYWGKFALDKRVRVPQFWSIAAFKVALKNKFVVRVVEEENDEGEKVKKKIHSQLADWWLNKRDRYTYDGLIFDANKEEPSSPDEINLWRGFGVEPNPNGKWNLMKDHIRVVIASNHEDWFKYIMNWLAYAVQHPTEHCEVMLLMLSEKHGTGKGFLGRTMTKIFGSHGMQVSKSKLVTGRFNAHLQMVGMLFVDECNLKNDDETGAFNTLLSEPTVTIEPKGIDAYTMPNVTKVIAASNQKQAVIASGDERRIAAFEVNAGRAQDTLYFKKIAAELDAGGYGAMLHELQTRALGEWHPRDTIPQTGALTTQKEESAAPQLRWFAAFLDSGILAHRKVGYPNMVGAADFFEHGRRTASLRHWTDHDFAKFVKDLGAARKRSNGAFWVFPALATMRAAWRARYPWWPKFDPTIKEWHSDIDTDDFEDQDADE